MLVDPKAGSRLEQHPPQQATKFLVSCASSSPHDWYTLTLHRIKAALANQVKRYFLDTRRVPLRGGERPCDGIIIHFAPHATTLRWVRTLASDLPNDPAGLPPPRLVTTRSENARFDIKHRRLS